MAIRVHDLAKELKISSGALIVHLKDMNIIIKSHMKLLEEDIANELRQKLREQAEHLKKMETEKKLIQEQLKNKRRLIEESKKLTAENPFNDSQLHEKEPEEKNHSNTAAVPVNLLENFQKNQDIQESNQNIRHTHSIDRTHRKPQSSNNEGRYHERQSSEHWQQRRTNRPSYKERTYSDNPNKQDSHVKSQRVDRPIGNDYRNNQTHSYRYNNQRTDGHKSQDNERRGQHYRSDHQSQQSGTDFRQRQYNRTPRQDGHSYNTFENRPRRTFDGKQDNRDDRRRQTTTDKTQQRTSFIKPGITRPEIKNQIEEKVFGKTKTTADEFGDKSKHLQAKLKNTSKKRSDSVLEVDEATLEKNIKSTLTTKRTKKKYKKEEKNTNIIDDLTEIIVSEFTSVSELAKILDVPPGEIITKFFQMGKMVSINQRLDKDSLELICSEYDLEIRFHDEFGKDFLEAKIDDLLEVIEISKPPVVTIMGHVDHGKTSILDKIRNTKVVAGESGGITQHIGAYQAIHNGHKITFIDTPGHEAFTAMRARGANITDVAVIVVAANDGVKPQTIEAIDHAKAAGVALVIAINKIDLHDANIDRTISSLLELNVFLEGYGGQIPWVKCSALKGIGIDELLEIILLTAEMKELKARVNGPGRGVVIESSKNSRMGTKATVLLQEGVLHKGDNVVVGSCFGHVRKMENERTLELQKITPSDIAVIYGLNEVPKAGDNLNVVENERLARQIASERLLIRQEREKYHTKTHLGNIYTKIKQNEMTELRLIVKADVDGSVEAVCDSLQKLSTDEIRIAIIRKSVGGIIEADVNLASASEAVIIGFNVRANNKAKKLAEESDVEIKYYQIIFEAIDDIRKAMIGMLSPEYKEKILGTAVVKQVFKIKKIGTIAGCGVEKGNITSKSQVRLFRDEKVIYTGELAELKHYNDSVKIVEAGTECGISIKNYTDIKEGDIIECFILEEIERTL